MATKRVKWTVKQPKRPIDKVMIFLARNYNNSQDNETLYTATFPCTVVGVKWSLTPMPGANTFYGAMYIVHAEDGQTAGTCSVTNGAKAFTPEQNVMASMSFAYLTGTTDPANLVGEVKTKRKLKVGDGIVLSGLTSTATETPVYGWVQFFVMT